MRKEDQPQLINETAAVYAPDPEKEKIRAEYRAKLAEKLKDPEFRKIEGFPIGTDEAILALSDPPYYTACPNPFIEEWLKEHGKSFDPETDDYHRKPFAADVSEGKNHPIYNAHSYHTKVPHRAIMRYILHYTEPGDVVYDGFCGTGMTGVAAQLCGDRTEVEALGYKVGGDGNIWELESWEANQAIEAKRTNPHPHLVEPKPFSKLGARSAVLNDLAPVATFIATNYNNPIDAAAFAVEASQILADVQADCGWMYATLHREMDKWTDEEWATALKQCAAGISQANSASGAREYVAGLSASGFTLGSLNSVVWSDVFVCPNCSSDVVFWIAAVDSAEGKVLEEFPCPSCNAVLAKSKCERRYAVFFDDAIGETIKQAIQVPVLATYVVGKKRFSRPVDSFDEAVVSLIARLPVLGRFPRERMPFGQETRRNDPAGISHVHHFYTRRNLQTLAAFNAKLQGTCQLNRLGRWQFDSLVIRQSKLSRLLVSYFFHGGGGWIGGPLSGTLYIPSFSIEVQPFETWENRVQKTKALEFPKRCGSAIVQTCSATVALKPESLDYMFVDPPFGGNLNYSELSYLWEAWLEVVTDNKPEAITSSVQRKGLPEYQSLMQRCFAQFHKSLKPGRWMTVEFHNSANAVWNSIQEALERVGFIVADVRVLDKGQYSFKQVNSSGATKKDLVISCYKPTARFIEQFERDKGTPEGVREFIEQHLEMLPVAPTTSTGSLESLAERTLGVLFDRMIAYHLVRGARIPLSASEFRVMLEELCYERDGMYFLPSQVVRYDALKSRGIEVEQLSIFVRDEKSAVQWVRNELDRSPQTLGELTPKFMQASQDWGTHEVMPELKDLLHQYFIREDDENWVVPDPDNEKHLEEVRRKAMLREFQEYVRRTGQLKLFRTEAVLAGFAHCWDSKQYDVIVGVCEKIPPKVLQEIQDLVMYCDIAKERVPQKITQFEFKWE